MIGTSTNYVYKTIQKMEDKSIISFKERRLKIINRELLRKLATEGAPD
ncbi:MAG: winged helix-turn-helix domain-containing protein [Sphingobacteriaceae bacterium]|nr:winged helix-turn-helix domain-containing protein [Sphingobacteriaceae bacterium]